MGNKLIKLTLFSLTIIPLKKNSSINPIIKPDKKDKRIVTKNTLSISFILKLKILISKICNKIIIGKDGKVADTFSSITKPSSQRFINLIEKEIRN